MRKEWNHGGDRQDVPVLAWCDRCGGEIYARVRVDGLRGLCICPECRARRREVAQ
jgi:Zn finger protein HypA/HybF involved in hydrogenase expression